MSTVMDLPEVTTLAPDDYILLTKNGSTYRQNAWDFYSTSMLDSSVNGFRENKIYRGHIEGRDDHIEMYSGDAALHNQIYRGKYMGTTITRAQLFADSSKGLFGDVWLGDYWKLGKDIWRVVAFDYYRGRQLDSGSWHSRHHVTLVNDLYSDSSYVGLTSYAKSTSSYNYYNSALYNFASSTNTGSPVKQVQDNVDSNLVVIGYPNRFIATDSRGYQTGIYKVQRLCDVVNSFQIAGRIAHDKSSHSRVSVRELYSTSSEMDLIQFPLMKIMPEFMRGPMRYCLRNPGHGNTVSNNWYYPVFVDFDGSLCCYSSQYHYRSLSTYNPTSNFRFVLSLGDNTYGDYRSF